MTVSGPDVQAILLKHGYTTKPGVTFNDSFVQELGDKLYVDVNAFSVRYGVDDDLVPDYPVRIHLRKDQEGKLETVGVVELTKTDKTEAETREAGNYPKRSPWPGTI
jgi:hypothetical protein